MIITDVRCMSCNCINLNISHKCIRCGSELNPLEEFSSSTPNTFSWDFLFHCLISGSDSEIKYALEFIKAHGSPALIAHIVMMYKGKHPITNSKINIDSLHKSMLLLALGIIGTIDAGLALKNLLNEDSIAFYEDDSPIANVGCYALGISQPSKETTNFLLEKLSNGNIITKHFVVEALKKYGDPDLTLENIITCAYSDLSIGDVSETAYFGPGLLGKTFSAAKFFIDYHNENRISTLTNLLMLTFNSSPVLVFQLSADAKRCWALQRRINIIESIVQRHGYTNFNKICGTLRKQVDKFIAASVICRLHSQPGEWVQVLSSVINGSNLTTALPMKIVAYDSIIRLMTKSDDNKFDEMIMRGLNDNNPVIRASLATSLLINGINRFYPKVVSLAKDPKMDVRISLVYALVLINEKDMAFGVDEIKKLSITNEQDEVKSLANSIIDDPEFINQLRLNL